MEYTIIVLATRNPAVTSEEFKNYYETKHIPLVRSLLGAANWPIKFTRRYLARIDRKGFGGPANPDRPLLTLRGSMAQLDCDCVAELTFQDEMTFRRFYASLYEKETAAKLAEDEGRFLDPSLTRVVVIEETIIEENGVIAREKFLISKSDVEDSDTSTS